MAAAYFQGAFQVGDKFGIESANALLSGNPGTSAPTSPYLYMIWTDVTSPTNPIPKQWNGTSWIAI
ncbi:MAG: hypothetical protein GY870_14980 [archaeon]|nr:hypothetical protein [archaeon]